MKQGNEAWKSPPSGQLFSYRILSFINDQSITFTLLLLSYCLLYMCMSMSNSFHTRKQTERGRDSDATKTQPTFPTITVLILKYLFNQSQPATTELQKVTLISLCPQKYHLTQSINYYIDFVLYDTFSRLFLSTVASIEFELYIYIYIYAYITCYFSIIIKTSKEFGTYVK